VTPSSKIRPSSALSCAQCEEQLADFLDNTLSAERKALVEDHLTNCTACAEFARDAAGMAAFTGRAAEVDVPATLIPQILAEITTGPSRVLVETSLTERIFGRWIRPMLQPRFALGLAMAALSIAVIPWRWQTAEISTAPTRMLTMAENRAYRVYDRALKGYEDLAVVAVARNQIDEWRDAGEPDVAPDVIPAATGGTPANGDIRVQPR
jgi:hypothetical protein